MSPATTSARGVFGGGSLRACGRRLARTADHCVRPQLVADNLNVDKRRAVLAAHERRHRAGDLPVNEIDGERDRLILSGAWRGRIDSPALRANPCANKSL